METISGSWLRFPNSFKKFHCLVELPNQLSLNINLKSGTVHVHKKDTNNVYQPFGELVVSSVNNQLHCTAIPHSLNETEVVSIQQSDAS